MLRLALLLGYFGINSRVVAAYVFHLMSFVVVLIFKASAWTRKRFN